MRGREWSDRRRENMRTDCSPPWPDGNLIESLYARPSYTVSDEPARTRVIYIYNAQTAELGCSTLAGYWIQEIRDSVGGCTRDGTNPREKIVSFWKC